MNQGQNAGHFQVPGTDRNHASEPRQDPAYTAYRTAWKELPARFETAPFPLHLDLESTNHCNLRCEYCTRNEMHEGLGLMDFDLFTKIIDEGSEHGLASIKLNRRGEPLMHPELPRFVRYAKERGIVDVQFNTNAMLLTAEKAEELIDAGVDRIIFSVDGTNPETFERMRPGAKYETVVNNIRQFVAIRDAKGLATPLTRIQMTTSQDNIGDAREYVRLWRDVVNRIGFNLRREPRKAEEAEQPVASSVEHYPCPQPWQRMAVYWNGDTVMCCGDWHKRYILGNANETTIRAMWTGKRMERARSLHQAGRTQELPICRGCEYNRVRPPGKLADVLEAATN